MMQLETERLILTGPSLELVPDVLEAILENFRTLTQTMPWVKESQTLESVRTNMLQAIDNFNNDEQELRFFIVDKQTGRLLGAIGLLIRNESVPLYEIGYWLRDSATGQGIMTEAVTRLERYAFHQRKARRVEIRCADVNLRSRGVAQRCGYEQEAILINEDRMPSGELRNTVIYRKRGF